MKIIQTILKGKSISGSYFEFNGGWLSSEFHWMSWALSCLQLKKYYNEVELYTNIEGCHFFKKKLKLPYSRINTKLENLNIFDDKLWALAKIYTYSKQKIPFLHIDGDVYIWRHFSSKILEKTLFAQNLEIDFPFYKEPLKIIEENFKFIPKCLNSGLNNLKPLKSCNTGVVGGRDLNFFLKYKNLAFDFIENNYSKLGLVDLDHFNICFEQYLFYSLAKFEKTKVNFFIKREFDPTYPYYADFHELHNGNWFIHAMADYKKNKIVCDHLARKLRNDYSDYYYRIIELAERFNSKLIWKCYPLKKLGEEWLKFYNLDIRNYFNTEFIFSQNKKDLLMIEIQLSEYIKFKEIDISNSIQIIEYPDITFCKYTEYKLDSFNIIMVDFFKLKTPIGIALLKLYNYYFSKNLVKSRKEFINFALKRLYYLLYYGILYKP